MVRRAGTWLLLVTLTDLIIAGLGLDLAGAYLLATEFLARPSDLPRLIHQGGQHRQAHAASPSVDRAHEMLNARLGLRALLLGFFVQAVAAFLVLAGVGQGDTGLCPALVGAACGIAGFSAPFIERKLRRQRQVLILLRDAAERYTVPPPLMPGAPPMPEGHAQFMTGTMLAEYGQEAGVPMEPGETRQQYIKRVFDRDYPEFINQDSYP